MPWLLWMLIDQPSRSGSWLREAVMTSLLGDFGWSQRCCRTSMPKEA